MIIVSYSVVAIKVWDIDKKISQSVLFSYRLSKSVMNVINEFPEDLKSWGMPDLALGDIIFLPFEYPWQENLAISTDEIP